MTTDRNDKTWKPVLTVHPTFKTRIQAEYPILKRVEERTGVPWQMLAAIWLRESSCQKNLTTLGGPFQFDPVPNYNQLRDLLKDYSKVPLSDVEALVYRGVNDFEAAATFAACFIKKKMYPEAIYPGMSDEVAKEALWCYNGKAYGSADRSPYVMNGYDADHRDMKVRGTINGKWVESVDTNPGAFVVYSLLCRWFPSVATSTPVHLQPVDEIRLHLSRIEELLKTLE